MSRIFEKSGFEQSVDALTFGPPDQDGWMAFHAKAESGEAMEFAAVPVDIEDDAGERYVASIRGGHLDTSGWWTIRGVAQRRRPH